MVSSAECELTYTLEFEGKTVYTGKKRSCSSAA